MRVHRIQVNDFAARLWKESIAFLNLLGKEVNAMNISKSNPGGPGQGSGTGG
jgi:hypothetical protein